MAAGWVTEHQVAPIKTSMQHLCFQDLPRSLILVLFRRGCSYLVPVCGSTGWGKAECCETWELRRCRAL